jgi:hypothetical protein
MRVAGFIHPGWLHSAELHGLQPAAIYSYTIPDCQSFPSNFSFQLPSPPAPDARTRFIVYASLFPPAFLSRAFLSRQ